MIEQATLCDAEALSRLEMACFPNDPWSQASLVSQLADETCYTYLVREGDSVVAYLTGRLLTPEAELYRVCTHPQMRGRGYGEALIAHFKVYLQEAGCDSLYLEVRASNTPAKALYEKTGFQVVGKRSRYYKDPTEDAVLYKMSI